MSVHVGLDYRPALFSRGGIGRSVRELARALHSADAVELELFAHGYKAALEPELSQARSHHGDKLHRSRLPGRGLHAFSKFGFDAGRLTRPDRKRRVEIFHWMDYVYPPVGDDIEVTMTVHDVAFAASARWHGDAASAELDARFRAALARATTLICPSQASADMLTKHYSETTAHSKIHVVGFGVDHVHQTSPCASRGRASAAERLRTDEDYVLMLGTLEPRKNHSAALDALELLAAKGRSVPLVITGSDGWQNDRLKARLAGDLPFPCHWARDLDDRAAYDLVAGASLVLYPSALEGFGFPPLEALELGVPVLVGDCDALRESCGDAASYVEGSDRESLASAIETCLDDDALRERQQVRWQRRRARFTWSASASAHAEIWSTIAAKRARERCS